MKCPGQDSRYWKPGAIFEAQCPKCGNGVEFFKDDTTRRCKKCGHRFLNPRMDFGCASYCRYAAQCIGTLPPELIAQQKNLLKDRIALETKRYFGKNFKKIGHSLRAARYAEEIGKKEGGDPAVIAAAAYLYHLGPGQAGGDEGDGDDGRPGKPGLHPARDILSRLGAAEGLIEAVCRIIDRRHSGGEEDGDFRSVNDAWTIVELEERQKEDPLKEKELERMLDASFLTQSGRSLAGKVLLSLQ